MINYNYIPKWELTCRYDRWAGSHIWYDFDGEETTVEFAKYLANKAVEHGIRIGIRRLNIY